MQESIFFCKCHHTNDVASPLEHGTTTSYTSLFKLWSHSKQNVTKLTRTDSAGVKSSKRDRREISKIFIWCIRLYYMYEIKHRALHRNKQTNKRPKWNLSQIFLQFDALHQIFLLLRPKYLSQIFLRFLCLAPHFPADWDHNQILILCSSILTISLSNFITHLINRQKISAPIFPATLTKEQLGTYLSKNFAPVFPATMTQMKFRWTV